MNQASSIKMPINTTQLSKINSDSWLPSLTRRARRDISRRVPTFELPSVSRGRTCRGLRKSNTRPRQNRPVTTRRQQTKLTCEPKKLTQPLETLLANRLPAALTNFWPSNFWETAKYSQRTGTCKGVFAEDLANRRNPADQVAIPQSEVNLGWAEPKNRSVALHFSARRNFHSSADLDYIGSCLADK